MNGARSSSHLRVRRPAREEWTYVCGRVAALEGDLLSPGFFDELLACRDLSSARAVVARSRYRDLFPGEEALADFDAVLAAHAVRFRVGLLAAAPPHAMEEFFELPDRYRAFRKKFLRLSEEGAGPEQFERALGDLAPHPEQQEALATHCAMLHAKAPPQSADAVARSLFADSAACSAAIGLAALAPEHAVNEALRDWGLLKAWLAILRAIWLGAAPDVVTQWFRLPADHAGFVGEVVRGAESNPTAGSEWLSAGAAERVREAGAEGVRADAEAVLDRAMGEHVAACRRVPFGPERVFAYLLALEAEAANLRLCLAVVSSAMERDAVPSRLRGVYG